MEHNTRELAPEVLVPQLLAAMEEAGTVLLIISGYSMTPFLAHRRDTVYLSKIDRPLKRGDMVFYRRDSGAYILHRVYRVEKDTFTFVGDAQIQLEPGIRPDQTLALVTAVRRKGKLLRKGSFWWDFFEKVWIRMVPVRPGVLKAYALISKLLR